VLRDVQAIRKVLQQRELADREAGARLVDLRIDVLRALEEGVNATAASIGELEDRMERARLLSRGDETPETSPQVAQGGAGKDRASASADGW
jgi:hypothetical protein